MRWALFWAGLLALSCFNLYWRWPADTGAAHWSEWLAFYGFPPIAWGLIWLAVAGAVRRFKKRDPRHHPLSAVKPLVFAILMTAAGWLPAANTSPRRFVMALLALG